MVLKQSDLYAPDKRFILCVYIKSLDNFDQMNNKLAFLFDLNGTMIDDMAYHVEAWYTIFNGLGANISIKKMKEEIPKYLLSHLKIKKLYYGILIN